MLNKLRERRDNESGFTLIELLVVILIIGILAAIALPAFLGQQTKGQDSEAKSNARNAVTQIESCYQDSQTYTGCSITAASGLKPGTAKGQVQANIDSDGKGYNVVAKSQSDTTFTITKAATGTTTRTCSSPGNGGCTSSWTS